MNNEKNFLYAIIITVLVLTIYPLFVKQFFPQLLPVPVETKKNIVLGKTPIAMPAKTEIWSEDITYSTEKSYILENQAYRITVNSPAGDIKSVELKNFINPATNSPTILCDTENKYEGIFALQGLALAPTIKEVLQDKNQLIFLYMLGPDLELKKTLRLNEETYSLSAEIEIKNLSQEDKTLNYRLISCSGIKNNISNMDARLTEFITVLQNKKVLKKNISALKNEEIINVQPKIVGIKTRYFTTALVPLLTCDYAYSYKNAANKNEPQIYCGVGIRDLKIGKGAIIKQNYILYAGPNDYDQMAALKVELEEIRGKGFFTGLSDFLLVLLRWFYSVLKNYGLAVIGLSLLINLFLYPLTFKSLKSMKEIQLLQPEIDKLKVQTKDDPQKFNKEVMELYKKHKVNPFGGCFPMLLQMPVFFALYQVLMSAVELRGAKFLWIKDLAAPDAAVILSQSLPFIGNSVNALPILMVVFTFFQQKITSSGQMNDQQKMMTLMMPILLGVIFYNFPAGLVLYFLVNTAFSFVLQAFFFSKLSLVKE